MPGTWWFSVNLFSVVDGPIRGNPFKNKQLCSEEWLTVVLCLRAQLSFSVAPVLSLPCFLFPDYTYVLLQAPLSSPCLPLVLPQLTLFNSKVEQRNTFGGIFESGPCTVTLARGSEIISFQTREWESISKSSRVITQTGQRPLLWPLGPVCRRPPAHTPSCVHAGPVRASMVI